MKKISVIGAGTMGNGIAHCFAQYDFEVYLVDLSKDNLEIAKQKISNNLNRMVNKGAISEEKKDTTLSNISFFTNLDDCVPKSDLVIEAATEEKTIKLDIFKKLNQIAKPGTILATNTSSISISLISSVTKEPQNVVGMHFMNPVPIMRLVEVIRGDQTSQTTISTIMNLSKTIQKQPVLVNDAPGFVANRILLPMINEAILTLEEGVSGVKEIDTVMILGMSHPMGPLQLADFIGLDVCLSILEILYEGFKKPKYKPANLLQELVKKRQLGVKTKLGFYDYSNGMKNKKALLFDMI